MSHPVPCLHSNSKLPKHTEQSSDGLPAMHKLSSCPGCVTPPGCVPLPRVGVCRTACVAWCWPSDALCFTPLGPGRCCLCTPAEPTGSHQWQMKKIILALNIWLPSPESLTFPWRYGCLTTGVSQDHEHFFLSPKKKITQPDKTSKKCWLC